VVTCDICSQLTDIKIIKSVKISKSYILMFSGPQCSSNNTNENTGCCSSQITKKHIECLFERRDNKWKSQIDREQDNKAANVIFAKDGRFASKEVILELSGVTSYAALGHVPPSVD